MMHLLTEVSIFVPLPNDCLCQVTGEPLLHMKAPRFIKSMKASAPPEPQGSNAKQPQVEELLGTKRKLAYQDHTERQSKRLKLCEAASRTSSFADKNPSDVKTLQKSVIVPLRC